LPFKYTLNCLELLRERLNKEDIRVGEVRGMLGEFSAGVNIIKIELPRRLYTFCDEILKCIEEWQGVLKGPPEDILEESTRVKLLGETYKWEGYLEGIRGATTQNARDLSRSLSERLEELKKIYEWKKLKLNEVIRRLSAVRVFISSIGESYETCARMQEVVNDFEYYFQEVMKKDVFLPKDADRLVSFCDELSGKVAAAIEICEQQKRVPTELTLTAENIGGDNVRLIARLMDGKGSPLPSKPIYFSYSYDDHSYVQMGTAVTDASGVAAMMHGTDKVTYYKAEFKGDNACEKSMVKVKYEPPPPAPMLIFEIAGERFQLNTLQHRYLIIGRYDDFQEHFEGALIGSLKILDAERSYVLHVFNSVECRWGCSRNDEDCTHREHVEIKAVSQGVATIRRVIKPDREHYMPVYYGFSPTKCTLLNLGDEVRLKPGETLYLWIAGVYKRPRTTREKVPLIIRLEPIRKSRMTVT
jgi:hypothetical protein